MAEPDIDAQEAALAEHAAEVVRVAGQVEGLRQHLAEEAPEVAAAVAGLFDAMTAATGRMRAALARLKQIQQAEARLKS